MTKGTGVEPRDVFRAQHVPWVWLLRRDKAGGWGVVSKGHFLEIGTLNAKPRHLPMDSGEGY